MNCAEEQFEKSKRRDKDRHWEKKGKRKVKK
jgi:hypothetical protein